MQVSLNIATALVEWIAAGVVRGRQVGTPWERFEDTLRATLGPPLKSLHEPVDAWLGSLPIWVAVVCAVGLYVVALVWTWCLPREFIFRGAPDTRRWRDLRIWATLVILPYMVIYLWLGR
jgi:hypothetical protein